ncbi:hypothetical protein SAMN05216241_1045 [Limimonas halophila]|uniref:Uncharacterized protein n=1 Tax=Limimonas halophila TaxID=1082479 RepID=A0A1G7QGY0_9PROT|nr:hypothetical protein [Limimonas halophila]SDF97725.1 hypothetical protein SAMN05216241_1045 [Limimonas halophila]
MMDDRIATVIRQPSQAEIDACIARAHRLRAEAAHAAAGRLFASVAGCVRSAAGRVRAMPLGRSASP